MRILNLPDSGAGQSSTRRSAPSAERNLAPIVAVLEGVLPATGRGLEIASGTGQHIAAFAQRFPGLTWQPTDLNPDTMATISAWVAESPNVLPPVRLDACQPGWAATQGGWDAICLTNLVHLISTPEAAALLAEVAKALRPGGVFCLYGPFRRDGVLVSDGDKAFDASLRAQDPAIGYKDIGWVTATLRAAGLHQEAVIDMPASNLMVITRRSTAD